jgi:hypothetical protein
MIPKKQKNTSQYALYTINKKQLKCINHIPKSQLILFIKSFHRCRFFNKVLKLNKVGVFSYLNINTKLHFFPFFHLKLELIRNIFWIETKLYKCRRKLFKSLLILILSIIYEVCIFYDVDSTQLLQWRLNVTEDSLL